MVKKESKEEAEKYALSLLEKVGLSDKANSYPTQLSGGQKQRIAIARMFASDPDLFILDEPTTGMDDVSSSDFYELMHHAAHKHGKSVLMVTHDPEEVKDYADRNIHLLKDKNGKFACFDLHTDRDRVAQENQQELKEEADV